MKGMESMENIGKLQHAAGVVLQEICAVLHIRREDFCAVLAEFLNPGAKKERKTDGPEATVLGYFQKLPQKYIVRDDGFELFKMVLKNAIEALIEGENCTIDGQAISKSWEKHRQEILSQLDKIHEKAADIQMRIVLEKSREKISDLISD